MPFTPKPDFFIPLDRQYLIVLKVPEHDPADGSRCKNKIREGSGSKTQTGQQ